MLLGEKKKKKETLNINGHKIESAIKKTQGLLTLRKLAIILDQVTLLRPYLYSKARLQIR